MSVPGTTRYWLGGRFRQLHYLAHGNPALPPLLCLHGLTRNGHDFDVLAAALADRFHVICPDMPGRGGSEWLDGPGEYQLASYLAALTHLMAGLGEAIDIVGTSMGGTFGMALASTPGNPVRRLVLNDIGSFLPAAALAAIGRYVKPPLPIFAGVGEAEAYLRRVHAPFGALTDAQWRHMALHSTRPAPDGRLTLHYDPAIADAFAAAPARDIDMSPWWNAIACPVLTLRGETSGLLTEATLQTMAAKSAVHVVAGCGHAPALMDEPTNTVIRRFLS